MTIREMPTITPIDIEQDGILYLKGTTLYPTYNPVISQPPTNNLGGVTTGLTVGSGSNTPNNLYDKDDDYSERYKPPATGGGNIIINSGLGNALTDTTLPTTQQTRLSKSLSDPVIVVAIIILAYFLLAK
jgi:hypothetical protein